MIISLEIIYIKNSILIQNKLCMKLRKYNFFFRYMFPIFKKAYKKNLTEDDLFKPLEEHKSSKIGSELERIWKEENKKHKKTALHRALHRLFGLQFWLIGVLKLFDEVSLV